MSHDRYLVNEVAGRIWAVEDGHVTDYKGNYDFYLEERDKNRSRQAAPVALRPRTEENGSQGAPEPVPAKPAQLEKMKVEKKPYSPRGSPETAAPGRTEDPGI